MKRRVFLAAAASLLSLFGTPAALADTATKKKKTAPRKPTGKPAGKSAQKGAKPAGRKPGRASAEIAMPQTTAEKSVLDAAHPGSSATRLPPVKAPEPPALWRDFDIVVSMQMKPSRGQQRLWLPQPMNQDTLYQRNLGLAWQGNFARGSLYHRPDGDLSAFCCEWPAGSAAQLELTTRVSTADRHFDISRRTLPPEREDILRRNLRASQQLPNDGEAYHLAQQIIGRILDPVAQARAIFDWVVDNTEYDASLPGCGSGDVRRQIEQRRYGGRSADINGLFVALCRAIGIPARRVYGLRIAPSRLAPSLGVQGDATLGMHCRAEFYVPGYSWIPVDPSDVRRTIAMEGLDLRDPKRVALRKILFGVWEMNWVAYNVAEDLSLPDGPALPFFAQPRLERPEGTLDGLDPAQFTYRITARQNLG